MAPPGAGKSTLLPLTILNAMPEGRVIMLEPRRLAARQVAERMAQLLGESVGKTVGYQIRFERKTSPAASQASPTTTADTPQECSSTMAT